jgi:hypothetical protein
MWGQVLRYQYRLRPGATAERALDARILRVAFEMSARRRRPVAPYEVALAMDIDERYVATRLARLAGDGLIAYQDGHYSHFLVASREGPIGGRT